MIAACITARNEAATIWPLVVRLRSLGYQVFVTDDGSRDSTGLLAACAGAHVGYLDGVGLAAGLLHAWQAALAAGATAIVQLDAGGSHDPAQAPSLLSRLADCDLVLGSRFAPGGRYVGGHAWRRWGSRLAAALCNLATRGARHSDWTSGYRAFTAEVARGWLAQTHRSGGHAWQIETLAQAGAGGWRIGEVPIRYVASASSLRWHSIREAVQVWWSLLRHNGAMPC